MNSLIKKFSAMFTIARWKEALLNGVIAGFTIKFISNYNEGNEYILGALAWVCLSLANSLIKEYYETVHLEIIFPGNLLSKEIISPAEAMAYYTHFTISAIVLSTFIGTFTMIIAIVATMFNQFSSKRCRKNPYRFPFSRGIISAIMMLYCGIELSFAKTMYFPAAMFLTLTYLATFIEYFKYYEVINQQSVKSVSMILGLITFYIMSIPYTKQWYETEYILFLIPVILTLIATIFMINLRYNKIRTQSLVWIIKTNYLFIVLSVVYGLK